VLGFCATKDPDVAVRDAIHAAVAAGRWDLAVSLINVVKSALPLAEVVRRAKRRKR